MIQKHVFIGIDFFTEVELTYYISFRRTTQWFNNSVSYSIIMVEFKLSKYLMPISYYTALKTRSPEIYV